MFQRQGIGFTNPFQFANPFQQFSGAVNPYTTQGGFGGINPLASQIGGFGINPFLSQVGGFGANPYSPQVGGFGANPYSPQVGGFEANPYSPQVGGFGANPYSPQIGGFGAGPLSWLQQPAPGLINPLYASQFGAGTNPAVNPLVAPQLGTVNPFLQSGIGSVNPLAAQLGGVNPFLQTGIGTVNPWGVGQAHSQGFGTDPSILSLLGQQSNPMVNPIAQQQLPIRPLAGANPFEQTAGVQGIGSITDPYTSLVQAQLLSQIANQLHQLYRSFPANLWATGQGTQPIMGHPFAQTGVPCGI
jgi:hypothetical protein